MSVKSECYNCAAVFVLLFISLTLIFKKKKKTPLPKRSVRLDICINFFFFIEIIICVPPVCNYCSSLFGCVCVHAFCSCRLAEIVPTPTWSHHHRRARIANRRRRYSATIRTFICHPWMVVVLTASHRVTICDYTIRVTVRWHVKGKLKYNSKLNKRLKFLFSFLQGARRVTGL